jgi:hypothetical protein
VAISEGGLDRFDTTDRVRPAGIVTGHVYVVIIRCNSIDFASEPLSRSTTRLQCSWCAHRGDPAAVMHVQGRGAGVALWQRGVSALRLRPMPAGATHPTGWLLVLRECVKLGRTSVCYSAIILCNLHARGHQCTSIA